MSMAILRSAVLRKILATRGLHTSSGRLWWSYPGWWFEDHKSRPWPRTEEERKLAATRYGLREGDYTPVKEDYFGGIGDYPSLGEIQYGVKDPYENYSYETFRRNFNEPVPWDFNTTTPDRYNYTRTEQVYGWKMILEYFVLYGSAGLLLFFILEFPIRSIVPKKAKQYPYDYNYARPFMDPRMFPLTHYTFEPADDPSSEPSEQPEASKAKSKTGHH